MLTEYRCSFCGEKFDLETDCLRHEALNHKNGILIKEIYVERSDSKVYVDIYNAHQVSDVNYCLSANDYMYIRMDELKPDVIQPCDDDYGYFVYTFNMSAVQEEQLINEIKQRLLDDLKTEVAELNSCIKEQRRKKYKKEVQKHFKEEK